MITTKFALICCLLWSSLHGVAHATGGAQGNVPYNHVFQKSAHNTYQRDEELIDVIKWHRVHSIEFDIHPQSKDGSYIYGDWGVYHEDPTDPSTCGNLSHCLGQLRAYHLENPHHEVITVFLDKTAWFDGWRPDDLDWRITQHIDESWILRPYDLNTRCPWATDGDLQ